MLPKKKKKDYLEMMAYVRPLMTFGEWNWDIGEIIKDIYKRQERRRYEAS